MLDSPHIDFILLDGLGGSFNHFVFELLFFYLLIFFVSFDLFIDFLDLRIERQIL